MRKKQRAVALILSAIFVIFSSGAALASDDVNSCIHSPHPESANISLPSDDAYHYPEQWTGEPEKANVGLTALESMYTSYAWVAYPVDGGDPITVEGSVMFVGVQMQSPFAGGALDWVRALTIGFLVDGEFSNYAYFAPGQFAPAENAANLSLGGFDDPVPGPVLEVVPTAPGGLAPVDPSVRVGRFYSSGGSGTMSFETSDGFLSVSVEDESMTAPIYPWNDGYDSEWGYYWVRPHLASHGTMTYHGVEYEVYGKGWSEREWGLTVNNLQTNFMERHISIQIDGCVTPSGQVPPCMHGGTNLLMFDVRRRDTGENHMHSYVEQGPSPRCETINSTEVDFYTLTPLEIYTSPLGFDFATKIRVEVPSREIDLVLTALVPDQHMTMTQGLFPKWYEGAAEVSGTIGGKSVTGKAMIESFNIPNGVWLE